MADVRTFRAASMREALDLVREELGADAVILHTRQVARRRFLPWRKPLDEVEITASLTFEAAPRKSAHHANDRSRRPGSSRTHPRQRPQAERAKTCVTRTLRSIGRGGLHRFATRPDQRAHRNTRRPALAFRHDRPHRGQPRPSGTEPPHDEGRASGRVQRTETAVRGTRAGWTAQPLHRPADRDQSGVRGRIRPNGCAQPAARFDPTDAPRPGPGEPLRGRTRFPPSSSRSTPS